MTSAVRKTHAVEPLSSPDVVDFRVANLRISPPAKWRALDRLSQLFVFLLCSEQDWQIGISVFPEREEILIILTATRYITC